MAALPGTTEDLRDEDDDSTVTMTDIMSTLQTAANAGSRAMGTEMSNLREQVVALTVAMQQQSAHNAHANGFSIVAYWAFAIPLIGRKKVG